MPRRVRAAKRRKLTMQEIFDLTIGSGRGSAFESDEERRETWFAFRSKLLAGRPAGHRPQAFWDYEGPEELRDFERPDDLDVAVQNRRALKDARIAYLGKNDLLSDAERRQLGTAG